MRVDQRREILSIFQFFSTGLLVLLCTFLPGFFSLRVFSQLKLKEQVSLSFGISFTMIALAYPVARILVPRETSDSTFVFTWFAVFFLSTFALIVAGFARSLDWSALRFWSKNRLDEDVRFLSAVFFFQFLLRMCYQALSPHVTTGGDWLEHFERSRYFLYRSQQFVAPFLP